MTDNESRVRRGGYKDLPCTAQTRDIRKLSESTTGLPQKELKCQTVEVSSINHGILKNLTDKDY